MRSSIPSEHQLNDIEYPQTAKSMCLSQTMNEIVTYINLFEIIDRRVQVLMLSIWV